MTDTKVRPALTAEEWKHYERMIWATSSEGEVHPDEWVEIVARDKGPRAAVAIGATLARGPDPKDWLIRREDVALLRNEATMRGFMALEDEQMHAEESPVDRKKQAGLNDLASRIETLLPPE